MVTLNRGVAAVADGIAAAIDIPSTITRMDVSRRLSRRIFFLPHDLVATLYNSFREAKTRFI